MTPSLRRLLPAVAIASILIIAISGVAFAHIDQKSITTEAGDCATEGSAACDSAAVYGPTGFTGRIHFAEDEEGDSLKVVDFICAHTPGDGPFNSFGGSYTLNLSYGGAALGSDAYTVTDGQECKASNNWVPGAFTTEGAAIIVPTAAGTTGVWVDYAVAIAGITPGTSAQTAFAGFNSIRNEAFDSGGGQARSESVKPPTTFIIPEAPLAILLVASAGLLAVGLVIRQTRVARTERA